LHNYFAEYKDLVLHKRS